MEDNKRVALIKQAILNELEGYEFYKLYAGKVSSAEVKKTFEGIAAEELQHIEFIKTLLQATDEDKLALASIEVPAPGIFKFSMLTPDDLSLALAAFSIAMRMEEDSQRFYQAAADETADESEKAFFLRLRDWEIVHRNAFEKEYKLLREEWWEENSFAPY